LLRYVKAGKAFTNEHREAGEGVKEMKLLPKKLCKQIPAIGATENDEDPIVRAKFFMPDGGWTWYVIEGGTRQQDGCGLGMGRCEHQRLTNYDPNDGDNDVLFFGFVAGTFPELGYFTLSELQSVRGSLGLGIERDMWFEACPLSEVRKSLILEG
jgi:hypothetical protein